jgi:hypothetical protein
MSHTGRLARYGRVSTSLALLSDGQLSRLVDEAPLLATGIGGTAVSLDIEGVSVFVKRVPLTDPERRPENAMSTANIFQLPTFYQYGVGSVGFGVWRELAAHVMTTHWVLEKRCESFPLMYHWRVLRSPPPQATTPEEEEDLARTVAYWDHSPAVRGRLEAIASSSARVALFLEYVPENLNDWLIAQAARESDTLEGAYAMVEQELTSGVSFMNARGLLHFDAHFRNILTDGRRLYFADFGLATSSRFDLADAEQLFFETNRSHDRCYAVAHLVNSLLPTISALADRMEYVRRCAEGCEPVNVAAWAAAIIKRYAAVATVMYEFYWKLRFESTTTPYPVDEIRRACTASGLDRYCG